MDRTTLFQRIGSEAAIRVAVDRFYERVLADSLLNHFFANVDMQRLKAHQFAFLSQALGGPKQYSGGSMNAAHAELTIEQRHFDAVAAHLLETLRELGIPEEIRTEVMTAVASLADQIVNTRTRAAIA